MAKVKRARKHTKIDLGWRIFADKKQMFLIWKILFTAVYHRPIDINADILKLLIAWGLLDKIKHRTVAASNIAKYWVCYWRDCSD